MVVHLFSHSPCFLIWAIEILSFRELRVLVGSEQECIWNSPEIVFQVESSVSIDGFLEWKCGRNVSTMEGEGVCSSYNCTVVPHTWLSFCVNIKGQRHEVCFWHLSAVAGASGFTFVVVSEALRSHLLRGYWEWCVGRSGQWVRGRRPLRAFIALQSLLWPPITLESREGIFLVYSQRNGHMLRSV